MTIFVDSLKRLYKSEKITLSQVKELLNNKKIVEEEYLYIIGKDGK